ncbi:MAG: ATP-binding protein [Paenibacillaceae bacterium]|nr:ATP-binding protein [Paenibacillaceae bacterium]
MQQLNKWLAMFGHISPDTSALWDQCRTDAHVHAWRVAHPEVSDDVVRAHVLQFIRYAQEQNHCVRCPGLAQCPHDITGQYVSLHCVPGDDGTPRIVEAQSPCSFAIAHDHGQRIRARIRSFYVDERALCNAYADDDMIARDLQRARAVEQVIDYVYDIKVHQRLPKKGLYFYGDFGTGKTFLASYMLFELAKLGYTGVIVFMPEFIEDLKRLMHDREALHETLRILRDTDMLVLDDIGAEQLNAWARDHVIGSLLNDRMQRKPTCYTSNQTLAGLEAHLRFTMRDGDDAYRGRRVFERIEPYVIPIEVRGANQRRHADHV